MKIFNDFDKLLIKTTLLVLGIFAVMAVVYTILLNLN